MALAKFAAAGTLTEVIIVGGGASGALMAFHLSRDPAANVRVTLIERGPQIGRGVAYATTNPDHLLNVPAGLMSAVADEPDHFCRWLRAGAGNARSHWRPGSDLSTFVPRTIYGDYLASLNAPFVAQGGRPGRLRVVRSECVSIEESWSGVAVMLADGSRHFADLAILAIGHDVPGKFEGRHVDPWRAPAEAGVDRDDRVLIVGTGLTMIDYVLSLGAAGHKGRIVAMSRRGQLPQVHQSIEPLRIDRAEIPFGTSMSEFLGWLRNRVADHTAQGGDWRGVIEGIRPYNQEIWQHLPAAARRSFLRHARPWWDVHRHRMAPEVESRITAALKSGRLTVMAAKVLDIEPDAASARIRYRRRGAGAIETMQVDKIVECRGVVPVPFRPTNPALCSLIEQGRARLDPLNIAIDVAEDGALIGRSGIPSARLFAVGPLARAALWEIIAIPEIRSQCAQLANRITRTRLRRAG